MPGGNVAQTAFFSIFALQHRGQESAGIASADGESIHCKTGMGLITSVFAQEDIDTLKGFAAIGHTRYSTLGSSKSSNAQPIIADGNLGRMALVHNGNLINSMDMRDWLSKEVKVPMSGSSDSEIIAWVYANAPGRTWQEKSGFCMSMLKGAYSLCILTKNELIAVRDPLGVRPLCLGKIGNGWIVASESAALDNVGAEFVRDVENGETIVINESGVQSHIWEGGKKRSMCIFEHIYFSRPDTHLDGRLVYSSRMEMGARLFREKPTEADIVMGVPESATAAAVGFSKESKIPFAEGIIRNRYVGRTFIQPDQRMRQLGVRSKFNVMSGIVRGKDVVLVDDSIVRGTTTPHVIRLLRDAGAKKIHMRVCSPPVVSTCHFGVDMARLKELIGAGNNVEQVRQKIGADSLYHLSLEGLRGSIGAPTDGKGFCDGCFTRKYPIYVQIEMDKLELENLAISRESKAATT